MITRYTLDMKIKRSLLLLVGLLSVGISEARTWTSSDGAKTFKGVLKQYDHESGKVTVLKDFREVSFQDDVLSDADRAWLKAWAKERVTSSGSGVEGELDEQKIGAKLKGGVLSKLEGGQFVEYELTSAPDYYVVYYSASW